MSLLPRVSALACLFVLAVAAAVWPASAAAQPSDRVMALVPASTDFFGIVRPGNKVQVEPGLEQIIVVYWQSGSSPVVNEPVNFSTDFGSLSTSTARTNSEGFAWAFLTSAAAGDATVRVTANDVDPDTVPIKFRQRPVGSDNYFSGGTSVGLKVFNDRIGFQAEDLTTSGQVLSIAATEGFTFVNRMYPNIYEFELGASYSRDTLFALAARLERDYPNDIRTAGLVVHADGAMTNWLLTDDFLLGMERGSGMVPPATDIGTYSITGTTLLDGCASVYITSVVAPMAWNILDLANEYRTRTDLPVSFAHPNFVFPIPNRDSHLETQQLPSQSVPASFNVPATPVPGTAVPGPAIPQACTLAPLVSPLSDPALDKQWHHNNTGLRGGIVDADIDAAEAWELGRGSHETRIAVIDSAFSICHRDLYNNLWDPGDGTRGRDFADDDHSSLLGSTTYPNAHGTRVAGIVAAIADNPIGGRGVCPECELLLIRHGATNESNARSLCFAIGENASAINNSWGPPTVWDSAKQAVDEAVFDNNIPVLFAMASVQDQDHCAGTVDFTSLEHVISVSSSTYLDGRTKSGYGVCADVLGPSRLNQWNGIVTTNVEYNGTNIVHNTEDNFGGTSAATPMVTGVVGLMLDANPGLSWLQVERVLQDTADKIHPYRSSTEPYPGSYDTETGFSTPSPAYFAYGRINAFEAVSLVAQVNSDQTDIRKRTRGGRDLVIRDHPMDWGNTIDSSAVLYTKTALRESADITRSPDIKIDVAPFEAATPDTNGFVSFKSEVPKMGERMRVYVRVRNRGPTPVALADLKLHWTVQQPLPILQAGFWSVFPGNSILPGGWKPLLPKSLSDLAYSGQSIAGCPNRSTPLCGTDNPADENGSPPVDRARITAFDLPEMDWDTSAGEKLSLLAIVNSAQDPVVPKMPGVPSIDVFDPVVLAKWDNNITLWSNPFPSCDAWLVKVIAVVLLIIAVIVIVVIIRYWPRRRVIVVITIVIAITIVTYIYIQYPACAVQVPDLLASPFR